MTLERVLRDERPSNRAQSVNGSSRHHWVLHLVEGIVLVLLGIAIFCRRQHLQQFAVA
jgi:uncharacterized membrane protein HdeD (DUF308 family)